MAGSVISNLSIRDPFVWVAAIMLMLLVIVFLWLMLVTMRRAGNDVWEATRLHRQQQHLARGFRPRSVYTPPATVEETSPPSMPLLAKFSIDIEKLRPTLPRLPSFRAGIFTGGRFFDGKAVTFDTIGCGQPHDVTEESRAAQLSYIPHHSTVSYRDPTYLPPSLQIGFRISTGSFASLFPSRSCSMRET